MGNTNMNTNNLKNTGLGKTGGMTGGVTGMSGMGSQTLSYLDARKRADELIKTGGVAK